MKCTGCGTLIKTHLWLKGWKVYCSPGCERGGKSQFAKTYKALGDMKVKRTQGDSHEI